MADVKKIATRESYGNALVELGKKYDNVVVLDATWPLQPKPACLRRRFRSGILTAASRSATW